MPRTAVAASKTPCCCSTWRRYGATARRTALGARLTAHGRCGGVTDSASQRYDDVINVLARRLADRLFHLTEREKGELRRYVSGSARLLARADPPARSSARRARAHRRPACAKRRLARACTA